MFYFVRHGKTDYSEHNQKIYQGYGVNLASLAEKGKKQIKQTAKDERLQDADLIISSPYTRALQSAAILSRKLNVKLEVETDLHEWLANKNYMYEEDSRAELACAEYFSLNGDYPPGQDRNWESRQLMAERVCKVLEKYSQYDKVIVVGHSMMIQAVTGYNPKLGEIVEFNL
ncbi:histidine phosphatase family protein [Lachnospiraceae bacterium oral taxon 500]|nr:histidine phosphatase family protein [Lachnospiraceae bacterium oral taxon 500]